MFEFSFSVLTITCHAIKSLRNLSVTQLLKYCEKYLKFGSLSLFIYLFSFDSTSYHEKENYSINYYYYYYYFVSKPFFSLFLSYILFYGHLSFDFGIQLRLLATYAYGFLYCRKNYVLISPCQRLWMAFSTLPRHILELKLNRLMVWLQYVCQLLQL